MIELWDSLNNWRISTHRTAEAAVRAAHRDLAAVKRANGRSSYITYAYRWTNGEEVDRETIDRARYTVDVER